MMKKVAIALAFAALSTSPAHAVVRGSTSTSTYSIGGGKCIVFQGTWYRIVSC